MAAKQNALKKTETRASVAEPRSLEVVHSLASETATKLDRLVHDRVRLGILSALAANRRLTFNELKKLLKTSDGNLSVHARKLEEAGYITCSKSFRARKPRTEYRLSAAGKQALERYLDHMEALVQAMRNK